MWAATGDAQLVVEMLWNYSEDAIEFTGTE